MQVSKNVSLLEDYRGERVAALEKITKWHVGERAKRSEHFEEHPKFVAKRNS